MLCANSSSALIYPLFLFFLSSHVRPHLPRAIASLAAACCRPRVVAWIPRKRRGIGDAPADFTVPNDLVCVRYRFAPFSGWIRGHLRSLSAQDRRQLARWERRSKTPSFSLSRLCHGGCRGKHTWWTQNRIPQTRPEHRSTGDTDVDGYPVPIATYVTAGRVIIEIS